MGRTVQELAELSDLTVTQVSDLLAEGLSPEVSRAWTEDPFTGERVHQVAWRRLPALLSDGIWQVKLCDCSRKIGVARCEFCGTVPTHPVQMRLA